jgi:hypothetical protein
MVLLFFRRIYLDSTTKTPIQFSEGKHVSAIIVAVPDYQFGQDANSGDFKLKIPLLSTDATYRVMFIVDKRVIDDQIALVENGQIELKPVRWNPPPPSAEDNIAPKKDVSDAELKALAITN